MNILCLALYDALWGQCRNQALLLKVLKENKNTNIVYCSCAKFIKEYCNAMANRFVQISDPEDKKQQICLECCSNSSLVVEALGVKKSSLEIQHKIKQQISLIKSKIPKWAIFEAIILSKNVNNHLSKKGLAIFGAIKRNSEKLYPAYKKLIQKNKPVIAITQHTAYSYNRVFNALCKTKSIPCYSLNSSLNISHPDTKALIFRDAPIDFYNSSIKEWPFYKKIPINENEANQCKDHIVYLMEGKGFAYSKKVEVQANHNNKNYKNHVVIFLSSYDELLASKYSGFMSDKENSLFKTQIDWLHWIYDYAKTNHQLRFTIRPHPREFTSLSGEKLSQHAIQLKEVFKEKPKNVEVNLPDQKLSAYDLLFDCDLILFSWSSVGLEAAMLGIPAITYFPEALLHPPDIVIVCKSQKEIELKIKECLKSKWSIHRSIQAFRWANYLFNATTVDLAGGSNLKSCIGLWLTKKLPLKKITKRKLEILFTKTRTEEKKLIYRLFKNKDRSFQNAYYNLRKRTSPLNERICIEECLKTIFKIYTKMSKKGNLKYSAFIQSLNKN